MCTKKFIVISCFIFTPTLLMAQNKDSLESFADTIQKRHNLFIEGGGASLFGSIGYAFRVYFHQKHFLELKTGVLYYQDLTHPRYSDYYLFPHIETTFNYKIKKIYFSGGISLTPLLNPFLLVHKNYNCIGGQKECDSFNKEILVGINFGISHKLRKRLNIKYTFYILHSTLIKNETFPWLGIALFYKLKY